MQTEAQLNQKLVEMFKDKKFPPDPFYNRLWTVDGLKYAKIYPGLLETETHDKCVTLRAVEGNGGRTMRSRSARCGAAAHGLFVRAGIRIRVQCAFLRGAPRAVALRPTPPRLVLQSASLCSTAHRSGAETHGARRGAGWGGARGKHTHTCPMRGFAAFFARRASRGCSPPRSGAAERVSLQHGAPERCGVGRGGARGKHTPPAFFFFHCPRRAAAVWQN